MTKAEELWERYSIAEPGCAGIITEHEFLAALKEYGQAIRKRDAEICMTLCEPDETRRDAMYNRPRNNVRIDCAAAIEREPLI